MISSDNGHVKISGDALEVNADLGQIIFNVFNFADEYPGVTELARKLFQDMIIQATIFAGCNGTEEYIAKLAKDKKFFQTLNDMIEPINQSIDLIRAYVNHMGEEEGCSGK